MYKGDDILSRYRSNSKVRLGKRTPLRLASIGRISLLLGLILLDMSLPVDGVKFAFPFALLSDWWVVLLWGILIDSFFPRIGSGLAIAVIVITLRVILTRIVKAPFILSCFFIWIVIIEFSEWFYPAGVMVGRYWMILGLGLIFWIRIKRWKGTII